MSRMLTLGILAHVDAGKTTLTERLLYSAGVIDTLGSVDQGTTQADWLELERQRGITIKSAVVAFQIDDVAVNLVDTPGHPDFIAEVERALTVLDGAVLVVSAVEGVQPQTRILFRALRRLRVPTLIFVNKIDRSGADQTRTLGSISQRLTPAIIAMGSTRRIGTPHAEFVSSDAADESFGARLVDLLAAHDDEILQAYLDHGAGLPDGVLRRALVAQTGAARVHPVFLGSAATGVGVRELMAGCVSLLPTTASGADTEPSGLVFKIERGDSGERIACVRMFSGRLRLRERVRFGRGTTGVVTGIGLFSGGGTVRSDTLGAGQIGAVTGLAEARIGDAVGAPPARVDHQFGLPTLETVIAPRRPSDSGALRIALTELSDQDPLIGIRQDDARREITVSLYGEVQKEVIAATLESEYGIEVEFHPTTVTRIERPISSASAIEVLQDDANPYSATVGLRVDPAPPGSGVSFHLDVEARDMPLYIFGTAQRFAAHLEGYVAQALSTGLHGWRVEDCRVTMTDCAYYVGDGPAKPTQPTPRTSTSDFKKLTPVVLRRALERAGTLVCDPVVLASIEAPVGTVGGLLALASRLGGTMPQPVVRGEFCVVEATLSASRLQDLRRALPGLTGGEGTLETRFIGFRPETLRLGAGHRD